MRCQFDMQWTFRLEFVSDIEFILVPLCHFRSILIEFAAFLLALFRIFISVLVLVLMNDYFCCSHYRLWNMAMLHRSGL